MASLRRSASLSVVHVRRIVPLRCPPPMENWAKKSPRAVRVRVPVLSGGAV